MQWLIKQQAFIITLEIQLSQTKKPETRHTLSIIWIGPDKTQTRNVQKKTVEEIYRNEVLFTTRQTLTIGSISLHTPQLQQNSVSDVERLLGFCKNHHKLEIPLINRHLLHIEYKMKVRLHVTY